MLEKRSLEIVINLSFGGATEEAIPEIQEVIDEAVASGTLGDQNDDDDDDEEDNAPKVILLALIRGMLGH